MSLQPSDPASEAFERLRLEVALLRRAVEGLAAERDQPAVDYSPTLAGLRKGLGEVKAAVADLGERPLQTLSMERLAGAQAQAASHLLARPLAELDQDRRVMDAATQVLRVAQASEAAREASWRRRLRLIAGGAALGALAWTLLSGPVVRTLPAAWAVPERLASATLELPMAQAGERLLARGDPQGWAALQVVRHLPASQVAALRACLSESVTKSKTCTVKLGDEVANPSGN